MSSKVKILGIIFTLLFSVQSFAAKKGQSEPYSFKTWKKHQVIQAKNEVVRLSNKIHLIKTGRYKLKPDQVSEVTTAMASGGEQQYTKKSSSDNTEQKEKEALKAAEKKVLHEAERKMHMALGNLQYTKELSIDDYLAVYLGRFKGDSKALATAADKLSKEEVSALLVAYLKSTEAQIPQNSPTPSVGGETASAAKP